MFNDDHFLPTINFQDYKLEVIDLLKRVCTVSVETVAIQDQMRAAAEKDEPK